MESATECFSVFVYSPCTAISCNKKMDRAWEVDGLKYVVRKGDPQTDEVSETLEKLECGSGLVGVFLDGVMFDIDNVVWFA